MKLAEESAEWDKLVEPVLYAHRTTVNNSTGLSPYNIVFEMEPRLITDEDDRSSQDWWKRLLNIVDGLPQLRERARRSILRAQEVMKASYPVKETKQVYQVGDHVTMW